MDPDMVRQQEEAEREALALLKAKPVGAPAKAQPLARPTAAVAFQQAPAASLNAASLKPAAARLEAATVAPASRAATAAAAAPTGEPAPAFEGQPRAKPKGSFSGYFGRFISFGLAGAMLGGGLGIVAASYLELPAELAKIAIFGPAGFFSAVCAFASFFTKTPKAYR